MNIEERIEQLIEDYERRIRSATVIIESENTEENQRERVRVKRAEYRTFKSELERLANTNKNEIKPEK